MLGKAAQQAKAQNYSRAYCVYVADGWKERLTVPQVGNLSPLLSNIMLNELDKELSKMGLKFVRYADDANIYVISKKSANRVMASITKFIEENLKLKVNKEKSIVDRPWKIKFLLPELY